MAGTCVTGKARKMLNSWETQNPQRSPRENPLYWDIFPGFSFPQSLRITKTCRHPRQTVFPRPPTSPRTTVTAEKPPQYVDSSDLRVLRAVSTKHGRDPWLVDVTHSSEPKSTSHTLLLKSSVRRAAMSWIQKTRLLRPFYVLHLSKTTRETRLVPRETRLAHPAQWSVRNSIGLIRRRKWWLKVHWVAPNFIPTSSVTSPSRTAFLLSAPLSIRISRPSLRTPYVSTHILMEDYK